MEKGNLPQDKSTALSKFTREVCYVKEKGHTVQELSTGWDVKTEALDAAWSEIDRRIEDARKLVEEGTKSPILFFMELTLMDFPTLSGYTGFWKFTIKRHFKPQVFKKLSDKKLQAYAKAFKITVDELVSFNAKNINEYIKK
jgi:hypothetical protein